MSDDIGNMPDTGVPLGEHATGATGDLATSAPPDPPLGLRISETLQTILTALILAFIFRAFFVEAFIIPTGSMAEGLVGVHATMVCPRCGWEFDVGPSQTHGDSADGEYAAPERFACPNCLLDLPTTDTPLPPRKAGDRILVTKWPYLFGGPLGPQRWDLVVFRDPANADQSFIKRLIALPGETVEIIDGDVFIDGQITRKPTVRQRALWRIVHDQTHAPRAGIGDRSPLRWVAAEALAGEGGWMGLDGRRIRFLGSGQSAAYTIEFAPRQPIRNWTGYNLGTDSANVGDIRLVAGLDWRDGLGWLRGELDRGDYRFRATVHADGRLTLAMTRDTDPPAWRVVAEDNVGVLVPGLHRLEFGHLDYQAYLRVGDVTLTTRDEDYTPDVPVLRTRMISTPISLRITAAQADFAFTNLRVERDVYYTYNPRRTRRADAGNPLALGDDEYFVLGDNSAFSHDSRSWDTVDPLVAAYYGRGPEQTPRARPYRVGTVRGDLILGEAAFVYLPGLMPVTDDGRVRMIDLGRVRFAR